jgi:hypothetical protein
LTGRGTTAGSAAATGVAIAIGEDAIAVGHAAADDSGAVAAGRAEIVRTGTICRRPSMLRRMRLVPRFLRMRLMTAEPNRRRLLKISIRFCCPGNRWRNIRSAIRPRRLLRQSRKWILNRR